MRAGRLGLVVWQNYDLIYSWTRCLIFMISNKNKNNYARKAYFKVAILTCKINCFLVYLMKTQIYGKDKRIQ